MSSVFGTFLKTNQSAYGLDPDRPVQRRQRGGPGRVTIGVEPAEEAEGRDVTEVIVDHLKAHGPTEPVALLEAVGLNTKLGFDTLDQLQRYGLVALEDAPGGRKRLRAVG